MEVKRNVSKKRESEEKRGKKKWLLLLLLLFFCFSVSLASPIVRDTISSIIIDTFKYDRPTAPVIDGGSDEWAKQRIIEVVKDAYSYNGIDYYEYCVTKNNHSRNCSWKRTNSKNTLVSKTGVYSVYFRAIGKRGTEGKISNKEVVYIDNNAPSIEFLKLETINHNSASFSFQAKDYESGIESYQYRLNQGSWIKCKDKIDIFDLLEKTEYQMEVMVVDKVGNKKVGTLKFTTLSKDTPLFPDDPSLPEELKAPTYLMEPSPESWSSYKVVTILYPEDVEKLYSLDGGKTWKIYYGPIIFHEKGTIIGRSKKNNKHKDAPKLEVDFIDPVVPTIDLSLVPLSFEYGSSYELPSNVSFGKGGGVATCKVGDTSYKNTKELKLGKYLIECVAKGNNGLSATVNKEVEVVAKEATEEVWDGYITLNLYYPDDSTERMWRLGDPNDVRDEEVTWEDYTGPITVRLSDVEKIYIKYKLDNREIIIPPAGEVAVDIRPDSYKVKTGNTTKVTIYYDEEASLKQYRVGTGPWKSYKEPFEVVGNTKIEARCQKTEEVRDEDGTLLLTRKISGNDAVYIDEVLEAVEVLVGPSITESNATFESTLITLKTKEDAKEIYVSLDDGPYKVYSKPFEVKKDTFIRAYYIRNRDGKKSQESFYQAILPKPVTNKPTVTIAVTPNIHITNDLGQEVQVTISGANYDSLEYSFDGRNYFPYVNSFEVKGNITVYAKAANSYGVTITTYTLRYQSPTTGGGGSTGEVTKPDTYLSGPAIVNDTSEISEKIQLTVIPQHEAKEIYYSVGGEYQKYTAPFEVTRNGWITAYYVRKSDGRVSDVTSYYVSNIRQGNKPYIKIDANPFPYFETGKVNEVTVTVSGTDYETLEYSFGDGTYYPYVDPLVLTKATTVYVRASNAYGSAYGSLSITNLPGSGAVEKPSFYLEGPEIIQSTTSITDKISIQVRPQEEASAIYYQLGNQGYQAYKGEFTVQTNMRVSAYYIRKSDGKKSAISYHYVSNIREGTKPYLAILASPEAHLDKYIKEVKITLVADDYNALEYSLNGIDYTPYTGPVAMKRSGTVYARAVNAKGETRQKLAIPNIVDPDTGVIKPPAMKEKLAVEIYANPDYSSSSGIARKVLVTISYDPRSTKNTYSINGGDEIEYRGPFEITSNCTVTAQARNENGQGRSQKKIDFLVQGIASPMIIPSLGNDQPAPSLKVSIEFDKNASVKKYKIGNGSYLTYTGPFEVSENTVITAYNENTLGDYAEASYNVENITPVRPPLIIDFGKYFLLKLNYPSFSQEKSREYKWKAEGTWKTYPSDGILLVKPQYKDELLDSNGLKIKIENENGDIIDFKGDYYIVDVSFAELMENIFMRWDLTKPGAPVILADHETITQSVPVTIQYDRKLVKQYYKFVNTDGTETEWLEYKGPFVVENNCTIYAKGENSSEVESKIASLVLSNIDRESPSIILKGDFETPRNAFPISVHVMDNRGIEIIAWEKGRQDSSYFESYGNYIGNAGTVLIEENGIYTFYAKDQAGNDVILEKEITNIDKTKPKIVIIPTATSLTTKTNIKIEFGNSITKKYAIGENTTTWKEYTGEFELNSYDLLKDNLQNEDGSFTVKAMGVNAAGNEETVIEKIYILDFELPKAPVVVTGATSYPVLTSDGVIWNSPVVIHYDDADGLEHIYSVDNGATWKHYLGTFDLKSGSVIARSVRKSGLYSETKQAANIPADAIGADAFDKNNDTFFRIDTYPRTTKKMKVSKDMIGKNFFLTYLSYQPGSFLQIELVYLDKNDTVLRTISLGRKDSVTTEFYDIVENTEWIQFKVEGRLDIYEMNPGIKITSKNRLPEIRIDKVYEEYNLLQAEFYQTDTKNYYKIGSAGEWKLWSNKEVQLPLGENAYFKMVDEDGWEYPTLTFTPPSNPLAFEKASYDKNNLTYMLTVARESDKVRFIDIDSSVWNHKIFMRYSGSSRDGLINQIECLDANGNSLITYPLQIGNDFRESFLIPEGTKQIKVTVFKPRDAGIELKINEIGFDFLPTFSGQKHYPLLETTGVTKGYENVTIVFDSTLKEKFYRIGETGEFLPYNDQPIRLEFGQTVYAKVVTTDGETEVVSYKSVALSNTFTEEAYDKNLETYFKYDYKYNGLWRRYKIEVSEDMQGKSFLMKWTLSNYGSCYLYLNYYDRSGNLISSENMKFRGYETFQIPANADIIEFETGGSAMGFLIYEIGPGISVSAVEYQPLLKVNGVDPPHAIITPVLLPSNDKHYYKIGTGEWALWEGKEYRLEKDQSIYFKTVSSDGKESPISSYTQKVIPGTIPEVGYDGDFKTGVGYSTHKRYTYTMAIDRSLWNEKVSISTYENKSTVTVRFMDKGGNIIASSSFPYTYQGSGTQIVTVPEDAVQIEIVAGSTQFGLYEIEPTTTSEFQSEKTYPSASSAGFADGYDTVTITYSNIIDQKLYRIGTTGDFIPYTGEPIRLKFGQTLYAKGITEYGKEGRESSYTSVFPSDAVSPQSYDGVTNTYNNGTGCGGAKKLLISPSLWNKKITILAQMRTYGAFLTVDYLDANGNSLLGYKVDKDSLERVDIIPEGTVVLQFDGSTGIYAGGYVVKELFISKETLELRNNALRVYQTPSFTFDSENWSESKEISINFGQKDLINEYSLDLGKTWTVYSGSISITEATTILARVRDEDRILTFSSYTITKIDSTTPRISLDELPDSFVAGTEYALPSTFSFNQELSGGTSVCMIDGQRYSSTKELPAGEYLVECSAETGTGKKVSVTKKITVLEKESSDVENPEKPPVVSPSPSPTPEESPAVSPTPEPSTGGSTVGPTDPNPSEEEKLPIPSTSEPSLE